MNSKVYKYDLKLNDEVYVKKLRKIALESPTAGPYYFFKYINNKELFKNLLFNSIFFARSPNRR